MPFNINEFISHAGKYGEFAKADKFDVRITIPNALQRGNSFGTRELAFQCEAAELPGRSVNTIEYRHHSFVERIPHFNNFNEITLTFLCNNQFAEKKLFDQWIDSMVPLQNGLVKYTQDDSYQNIYTSTLKIRQYSLTGPSFTVNAQDGTFNDKIKPIYVCTLIDAIPVAISPLSLSWSDDSTHRLQVNFAYKYWKTEDINPDNLPGFNREGATKAVENAFNEKVLGNSPQQNTRDSQFNLGPLYSSFNL